MREITAPREFLPFEEICTLTPFIERLSREFKDVACEYCFERNPNLKSCKACSDVKYCGQDCQKKDWKIHSLECQKLKNLPLDLIKADTTRLYGNTILKIKGKDWKSIKINVLGMDASFDDVDASLTDFPTYRHIVYNSNKEEIRRYIGDENMPNDEDFKQIFGKIRNSLYPNNNKELRVNTSAVFFEPPLFEVKCIPNCLIISRKDSYIIKAFKKIEKSEKLSLRNIPLFGTYGTFDIPRFTSLCSCTECRLPYGESVLSKITNERKALGVIRMTQQFITAWTLYPGVLRMPDVESIVDDLLNNHEGVLGDTNALHLKLLDIKCFEIGGDPLDVRSYLLKLEKNIKAAFGEYHPHLGSVYAALSKNYLSLRNYGVGMMYLEKAKFFLKMFS